MTADKLTDSELLHGKFCYWCGGRIEITYTGVIFDETRDHPQVLNLDGTPHNCAARAAVGKYRDTGRSFKPAENSNSGV